MSYGALIHEQEFEPTEAFDGAADGVYFIAGLPWVLPSGSVGFGSVAVSQSPPMTTVDCLFRARKRATWAPTRIWR